MQLRTGNPVPTFNWAFEYQPIGLEISAQLSCYKRSERNFLADEKGPHILNQICSCLVYTFIFSNLLIYDFACFDVWLHIMKKKRKYHESQI